MKCVIRSVNLSYRTEGQWNYLDNVDPKHLSFPPPRCALLTSSLAAQEVMPDFCGRHNWRHIKSVHVPLVQIHHLSNIAFLHLSQARSGEMRGGREFILEHHPSPGRISWDVGELDVEELRDVERTMVISYEPSSVRTQSQVVVTREPAGG